MKPTIAQLLKVKDFPFIIKDKNGNVIYHESSNGFWNKREYNYNARGNIIYFCYEDSNGYWSKFEYDDKGNEIYYETSNGTIVDKRTKPVVEMTLQEVADKLGVDVKNIRIKD